MSFFKIQKKMNDAFNFCKLQFCVVLTFVAIGSISMAHAQEQFSINGMSTEHDFDLETLLKTVTNCKKGSEGCSLSSKMDEHSSSKFPNSTKDGYGENELKRLYKYQYLDVTPEYEKKVFSRLNRTHEKLPEVVRLRELQKLARKGFVYTYICSGIKYRSSDKLCPAYFKDKSETLFSLTIELVPEVGQGEPLSVHVRHHTEPNQILSLSSVYNGLKKKYPNNAPADFSLLGSHTSIGERKGVMAPDGNSMLFVQDVFNNSDYNTYTVYYSLIKSERSRLILDAMINRVTYLDKELPKALNAVTLLLDGIESKTADIDF